MLQAPMGWVAGWGIPLPGAVPIQKENEVSLGLEAREEENGVEVFPPHFL